MPMDDLHHSASALQAAVQRLRRVRQLGLALRTLLRWGGWAALALAGLAVADYFLVFPPRLLLLFDVALLGGLAAAAILFTREEVPLPTARAAVVLDELAGSRRQDIRAALELSASGDPRTSLGSYLAARGIERGLGQVRALSAGRVWPGAAVARQLRTFLLQAGLAAALLAAGGARSWATLHRLFCPLEDAPPYTTVTFDIEPKAPRVVYGGNLEISAALAGGPVAGDVLLLTRQGGRVHRTPCFREDAGRYAQRLERLTEPVEFAFQSGRARSGWHPVEIWLEPQVEKATLTVTPPAYTHRPARTFAAGGEALADYEGARVSLELVSNRPLSGGELLAVARADGATNRVRGVATGARSVRFEWTLDADARIEAYLADARGLRGREPLRLAQRALPDEPPRVSISDPPAYAIATPTARVKLSGLAEDDLGLRRAELVRALAGFRDRALDLGPSDAPRRMPLEREIDLAALGVQPGQTLEFCLEALDTNPRIGGFAASDPVRIHIVSEEDLAEQLRARERIEDFLARYREVARELEQVRQALEEAQKAAEGADAAAQRAALEKLRQALEQGAEAFDRLARDLPLYDIDKQSREAFRKLADQLAAGAKSMAGAQPGTPSLKQQLQALADQLNPPMAAAEQSTEQAAELAAAGRVMELAVEYQELLQEQESLARRLGREVDAALLRDPALLRRLAQRQDEIRDRLLNFQNELRARAEALPKDKFEELWESAQAFADAVGELGIPAVMKEGVAAAGRPDPGVFRARAEHALELMRQLLNKPGNCMGGMCKGSVPRFKVDDLMQQALQQMLGACRKRGGGTRAGAGAGPGSGRMAGGSGGGGFSSDGYAAGGSSPLNLPAYGPQGALGGPGRDGGRGRSGAGGVTREGAALAEPGAGGGRAGAGLDVERAPEKYRNALKAYFSGTEDQR